MRELERALAELRERAGTRDRDLDLLAFEIEEIEELDPSEEEKESLVAERSRLRQLDGLLAAAGAGAEAIAPSGDEPGRGHAARRRPRASPRPWPARTASSTPWPSGSPPCASRPRTSAPSCAATRTRWRPSPGGWTWSRSASSSTTGSSASTGAAWRRCSRMRSAAAASGRASSRPRSRPSAPRRRSREARAERDALAEQVGAARREAAPRLAERVREELAALAMENAAFEVRAWSRAAQPSEPEIGPTGAERVEFMLGPNPGVPAAPIRDAASGGELSRVMLALMTVAGTGESRTLVFDEVDAGVGGQTARAVGERLRALGDTRQVLCITHLPQIAALASAHFRIEKSAEADTALTTVEALEGDGVVAELCRMLGAEASDKAARRHAKELLAAA